MHLTGDNVVAPVQHLAFLPPNQDLPSLFTKVQARDNQVWCPRSLPPDSRPIYLPAPAPGGYSHLPAQPAGREESSDFILSSFLTSYLISRSFYVNLSFFGGCAAEKTQRSAFIISRIVSVYSSLYLYLTTPGTWAQTPPARWHWPGRAAPADRAPRRCTYPGKPWLLRCRPRPRW